MRRVIDTRSSCTAAETGPESASTASSSGCASTACDWETVETLGLVLGNSTKVLIDTNAQGGAGGVIPYLPLPEIQKRVKGSNQ